MAYLLEESRRLGNADAHRLARAARLLGRTDPVAGARTDSGGPLTNLGYHGELLLLTEIATPKRIEGTGNVRIEAKAEWLICKEVCLPGGTTVSLELPVGDGAPDPTWSQVLAQARAAVPQRLQGWTVTA